MFKTNNKQHLNKILKEFIPKLVCSTEEIENYVGKLNKVYHYSLLNQLLGQYQFQAKYSKNPELLLPYTRWQKLGRQVKKGSKAVYFRRPQTIYKEFENEETGEKEVLQRTIFKWFAVFDITQTVGEPITNESGLVSGKSELSSEILIEFLEKLGYDVIEDDGILRHGSTNGTYIKYSKNLDENERICTLFHELAHNRLDHIKSGGGIPNHELEAESVSYILSTFYGLENEKARLYINTWDGTPEKLEKRSLKILSVANSIINELNEFECTIA